jgi:hypothetical protein
MYSAEFNTPPPKMITSGFSKLAALTIPQAKCSMASFMTAIAAVSPFFAAKKASSPDSSEDLARSNKKW